MQKVFADLHVHIGQSLGRTVKVTASPALQLRSILYQDAPRKGLDMVGIVDSGSLLVRRELEEMLDQGELTELPGGGFQAKNGIILITACEVESREGVHLLVYLPGLESLDKWQDFLRARVHNLALSTQKAAANMIDFIELSRDLGGIFCPAHAFTPHKGIYGHWTPRLRDKLGTHFYHIKVLELGLSSDSDLADMLEEPQAFTFLANSDAHSSANLGREYNLLSLHQKNFQGLKMVLENGEKGQVLANYGMDPRMGKYHRSFCDLCGQIGSGEEAIQICSGCGNPKILLGVYDRILMIRDYDKSRHPQFRPPYYYRVPLKDIPGVGPKMYARLIGKFTNEIEILEKAAPDEIAEISSPRIASIIERMRRGRLDIQEGGGGKYGKLAKNHCDQ